MATIATTKVIHSNHRCLRTLPLPPPLVSDFSVSLDSHSLFASSSPILSRMGTLKRRERYEEEQWAKAQQKNTVLMSFDRRGQGWRVVFRDRPSNRRLPRVITFIDPDKIRNLYQRVACLRMSRHSSL